MVFVVRTSLQSSDLFVARSSPSFLRCGEKGRHCLDGLRGDAPIYVTLKRCEATEFADAQCFKLSTTIILDFRVRYLWVRAQPPDVEIINDEWSCLITPGTIMHERTLLSNPNNTFSYRENSARSLSRLAL